MRLAAETFNYTIHVKDREQLWSVTFNEGASRSIGIRHRQGQWTLDQQMTLPEQAGKERGKDNCRVHPSGFSFKLEQDTAIDKMKHE